MDGYSKKIINWIASKPYFSLLLAVIAFGGYSNIFVYGYLFFIPPSLRPFLDGYFYSNLALDFFMSFAAAGALSRILVLSFRLFIKTLPNDIAEIYFGLPVHILNYIFGGKDKFKSQEKHVRVYLLLFSRWLRRKNIVITFVISFILFSVFFLGRQSYWYIPICLILLPLLWLAISRVELRRNFATINNTSSISMSRILNSAISLLVIYFAVCVFLAGLANFNSRMDLEVSVGANSELKNTSLLAVTSSGVLVGEHVEGRLSSVHFVPFDVLSSVGQKY